MSRKKTDHPGGKLAETIKAIRTRLGMNMAQFAQTLEVTHGQVSRYEAGNAVPSEIPLGHLLDLAEGTEKNPILHQLAVRFRGPGTKITEAAALAEVAAYKSRSDALFARSEALWFAQATPEAIASRSSAEPPPFCPKFLGLAPNLAALLGLLYRLYDRKREVDASLVKIVRLWISYDDNDPAVKQCFADAAQYLDLMLSAKASNPLSARPERAEYRVIRAIDFGDGVIHQQGEIVELDWDTSTKYMYALLSVEEEGRAQLERKKLA